MKQPNPSRDLAAAQAKRKNPSLADRAYGAMKAGEKLVGDIYVGAPIAIAKKALGKIAPTTFGSTGSAAKAAQRFPQNGRGGMGSGR